MLLRVKKFFFPFLFERTECSFLVYPFDKKKKKRKRSFIRNTKATRDYDVVTWLDDAQNDGNSGSRALPADHGTD